MSEQEKAIAETFNRLIPRLSEIEKAHTLGYLEGMAAMAEASAKDAVSRTPGTAQPPAERSGA